MKRYNVTSLICVALLTVACFATQAVAQRASVSVSEVTGTFRMNFSGKYRKESNEIKIASAGRGKIHVAMALMYPYTTPQGELSANLGQMDDEFVIQGDSASYATSDGRCTLMIKFVRAGTIKVTQSGDDSDCGFGHNVMATGTYRKVSGKKPNFDVQH